MNTIEWRQEQLQKRKRSEALDKIAIKRTQEILRDLQKPSNYMNGIKDRKGISK